MPWGKVPAVFARGFQRALISADAMAASHLLIPADGMAATGRGARGTRWRLRRGRFAALRVAADSIHRTSRIDASGYAWSAHILE